MKDNTTDAETTTGTASAKYDRNTGVEKELKKFQGHNCDFPYEYCPFRDTCRKARPPCYEPITPQPYYPQPYYPQPYTPPPPRPYYPWDYQIWC